MRRAVWIGGVAVGVLVAASVARGAPEALDSYAVGVAPSEPNRVVVFSQGSLGHGHWVTTSMDGGATWGAPVESAATTLGLTEHAAVLPGGVLLVQSDNGKVFRSANGGVTWKATLKPPSWGIVDVVSDAARPKVVWAWNPLGMLFRSVDGGIVWRRALREATGCTDVDAQPGTKVVLATCDMWVRRSVNRGATWRPAGPTRFPLPLFSRGIPPRFESLAFDPSHPAVVVATALRPRGQQPQLWRSTNAGRRWRKVATPNVSRVPVGRTAPGIGAIRVTAGAGQIIVGPFTSAGKPVFLASADGGATWSIQPLDAGLPSNDPPDPAIPDPARAAGSSSGLFMPIPTGKERIWGYRSASPLWGAISFYVAPAPPPVTE